MLGEVSDAMGSAPLDKLDYLMIYNTVEDQGKVDAAIDEAANAVCSCYSKFEKRVREFFFFSVVGRFSRTLRISLLSIGISSIRIKQRTCLK